MEKTKLIRVGNVDLAYRIKGKGSPVVLIMGLTADMEWWPPTFVDGLAEKHRVLMFDNRGSGRSHAGGLDPFSIQQFVLDTLNLMDAVKIRKAHVLGASMGGMIAQQLALEFPERVDHLILSSTSCGIFFSRPPRLRVFMEGVNPLGGRVKRNRRILEFLFSKDFIKKNPEPLEDLEKRYFIAPTNDYNAVRQLLACLRFDSRRKLPFIKSPTLVISGEKDPIFPGRDSEFMAKRIPDARLVRIEDAGHIVINQYPERCCDLVKEFIEDKACRE